MTQSESSRAEAEAAEKRRWSFLEVDTARDEEVNEAGQAVQVITCAERMDPCNSSCLSFTCALACTCK